MEFPFSSFAMRNSSPANIDAMTMKTVSYASQRPGHIRRPNPKMTSEGSRMVVLSLGGLPGHHVPFLHPSCILLLGALNLQTPHLNIVYHSSFPHGELLWVWVQALLCSARCHHPTEAIGVELVLYWLLFSCFLFFHGSCNVLFDGKCFHRREGKRGVGGRAGDEGQIAG